MTRIIVITSGKGGVGKTNLAVNAAIELASRNYSACVLDGDLGLANVNILLDIQPERTLDDFLFNGAPLTDVVLKTKFGIDIIPGSSGIEKTANLEPAKLDQVIAGLQSLQGYDYFLIDTSSGISRNVIALCLASEETIVVISPESTSLTDGYSVLKVLDTNNYDGNVKVIVNKCPNVPVAQKTYTRFKTVADKHLKLNLVPAGLILDDSKVEEAISRQKPILALYPNSLASQCIRSLVSNLIKQGDSTQQKDFGSFWSKYFELMQANLSLPNSPDTTEKSTANDTQESDEYPVSAEIKVEKEQRDSQALAPENNQVSYKPTQTVQQVVRGDVADKNGPTRSLPTPIPLLTRVLELKMAGQHTQAELISIISHDPATLMWVLRLYKISFPGFDTGKFRIKELVERLGIEEIYNYLCTTALQRAMEEPPLPSEVDVVNSFWLHSNRVAILAKNLVSEVNADFAEDVLIAGLLHDTGRVIMQRINPEFYATVQASRTNETNVLETETQYFGKSHCELSVELLQEMRLNNLIVDAVQYHTVPDETIHTALEFTKLFYFAHKVYYSEEEQVQAIDALSTSFRIPASKFYTLINKTEEAIETFLKSQKALIVSPTSEVGGEVIEEQYQRLRAIASEYQLLNNTLPTVGSKRTNAKAILSIHQTVGLLTSLTKVICLLPDATNLQLEGIGFPGCFGEELLHHVVFSLNSSQSQIVSSYVNRKIVSASNKTLQSLADKQLLELLKTDGFICLPMISADKCYGLLIAGVPEESETKPNNNKTRLKAIASQSASIIAAL